MRTSQVFDSSALIPLFADVPRQRAARRAVSDVDLVLPHLADAEVMSGLRGMWLRGELSVPMLTRAVERLATMPASRVSMLGLHQRVLQLRHNLTAYDATYVALAEKLDLELVTFDRGIARAPGIACDVILLDGS